jgi:acetate kinase
MKILVFNAGSSSQKSRLYDIDAAPTGDAPEPLWAADADWGHNAGQTELKVQAKGRSITRTLNSDARPQIIKEMVQTLWSGDTAVIKDIDEIDMVGHRVVHGGPEYQQSVRVTPQVKDAIQRFAAFAPLHNPANLEGIEAIEQMRENLPQVAVFDTAFHKTLPPEVTTYPGPYEWVEQGIRRYGFHGISHSYCTRRATELAGGENETLRIVNCHIGNGASLAAIRDGESVDTTMGFTPLEGLMMGGRSGTIDPSILIYLQREKGCTVDELERILNKESGLKGVSGVSSDLRQVLQAIKEGNKRAQLAFDTYIYRLRYFIGAMIVSLGGIDILSFTGGVGENSPEVRARTCAGLRFLSIELDEGKNESTNDDERISTDDSAVRVLVIHTQEDWEIARECWLLAH